ncbi:hypothetical protein LOZ12_002007 [Ophidiomyces ophidiicola]|uniref:Uncharacterized protein n=1 Tax=Ophidiomyces ophidiicola TaxID=1387563 RepID=A0ACB8V1H2_9EURO|nr:uncharacterized protein LOZ57_001549 [Ophidiomyces ophidiicola]KAI1919082.1 hypothetical protein LOZ64_002454 [Ophidiomyces ophidiicola]KAI1951000.1 hypothetical protein LOZ57_001549 [Ophidiomyces ophidiicola]KAI1952202.1 hypothetical protein LOZ62_001515 [Ophidiomyces ophidiicola]KAI1960581.1 hypothetical protein LOZ59_002655 [Ophidiomyces ophidiicola]KAI1973324.1 hypothetical protein LOZ56_001943 [Ophidiomyces ophidiicola]
MESLSASEQRIFSNGMICAFEGLNNIKVDYTKLAAMSGLKNASVASVLFNKARRKLVSLRNSEDGVSLIQKAAAPEKVTKRTAGRKNTAKAKKTTDDVPTAAYLATGADSPEDSSESTPVKKRVAGRRAATAKKIKSETKVTDNAIDLINDSIKLEDGIGYESMLGHFGEGIIDNTVYGAVHSSSQITNEVDVKEEYA